MSSAVVTAFLAALETSPIPEHADLVQESLLAGSGERSAPAVDLSVQIAKHLADEINAASLPANQLTAGIAYFLTSFIASLQLNGAIPVPVAVCHAAFLIRAIGCGFSAIEILRSAAAQDPSNLAKVQPEGRT